MGRRYADGISAQNLNKIVRAIAFENIGFEIDMENSSLSLLYLELQALKVESEYPIVCKIRNNPSLWREIIGKYYDITVNEAKKMLIRTIYGGKPQDDNPLLWALLLEVIRASQYLLQQPKYVFLHSMYSDRKTPLFSRLFILLSINEDKILTELEKCIMDHFPEANVSLLMYDGLEIYMNKDLRQELSTILKEFSNKTGVNMKIKRSPPTSE